MLRRAFLSLRPPRSVVIFLGYDGRSYVRRVKARWKTIGKWWFNGILMGFYGVLWDHKLW